MAAQHLDYQASKQGVEKLLDRGMHVAAERALRQIIELIPADLQIPHGRPYATISKSYEYTMKQMALHLISPALTDRYQSKAEQITRTLSIIDEWFTTTEAQLMHKIRRDLEKLEPISYHSGNQADNSGSSKLRLILELALENIFHNGSPPVLEIIST